jgi:hypothetical protein
MERMDQVCERGGRTAAAWKCAMWAVPFLAGVIVAQGLGPVFGGRPVAAQEEDEAPKPGPVYELRTYTAHPGRLEALHTRFRVHTMKLFAKHGMKNLMYWVPTDKELSKTTLIYVLEHESQPAAKRSWDAFLTDPEWKAARDESEKDGKIVAKVESVFMTAVPYSPHLKKN